MFLDLFRRRNPGSGRASDRAASGRASCPPMPMSSTSTRSSATRAASPATAAKHGLKTFAMTKQMGRNASSAKPSRAAAFATAVAVDMECARACHRAGLRIGHLGHLVQIPRAKPTPRPRWRPTIGPCSAAEKAAEASAASVAARPRASRRSRASSRQATRSIAAMRAALPPPTSSPSPTRSTRAPGARFAGVTSFPDPALRRASAQGEADAQSDDARQGGRSARRRGPREHRDQRARHDLDRDPADARRRRRHAGRARPRPHRHDAAACVRGPARDAGRRLSQRSLASASATRPSASAAASISIRCFPTIR